MNELAARFFFERQFIYEAIDVCVCVCALCRITSTSITVPKIVRHMQNSIRMYTTHVRYLRFLRFAAPRILAPTATRYAVAKPSSFNIRNNVLRFCTLCDTNNNDGDSDKRVGKKIESFLKEFRSDAEVCMRVVANSVTHH